MFTAVSNSLHQSGKQRDIDNHKMLGMLYDKYAPKMYGFILPRTKSKREAEELLTIIFLKIWDDIENFEIDPDKKIAKLVIIMSRHLTHA